MLMDKSKPARRATVAAKERTFLANAAHELRTPLHSANGFVEMMLDGLAGTLNERQHEMLGYAHVAIGQLGTLIEDIIFLARTDSGEIVPHLSNVNPAGILTSALESIREHVSEQNVALTYVATELPTVIQADGERLRAGILGLLRGCLSLMPSGGVIQVAVSASEKLLSIEVILENVQLDATDIRHLFDRFSQPRPLGAQHATPPGLGLAIARLTAEWHSGTTRAKSTPDGSLVLSYELPLND